jgi:hypothetical protein
VQVKDEVELRACGVVIVELHPATGISVLPGATVTARTVLPVSEKGPSTVIWPLDRIVVQLHSHVFATTIRTQ